MVFLILMVVLIAAAAVMISTWSLLRRRQAGVWWWTAFIALLVSGLVAGSILSFWEHQDSPTRRLIGWPFPAAVFKLEEGQWVDYVTPVPAALLIMVFNAILVASAASLPLLGLAWSLAGKRREIGKTIA
jgi:hypothetical protein